MEHIKEIKCADQAEAMQKVQELFESDNSDLVYITVKRVFDSYWVEVENDSDSFQKGE